MKKVWLYTGIVIVSFFVFIGKSDEVSASADGSALPEIETDDGQTESKDNEEEQNELLTVSNGYRFKNNVWDVNLTFSDIHIEEEWEGILPQNGCFLIMKVDASIPEYLGDSIFDFPKCLVGASGETYETLNSALRVYQDQNGNAVDIATEINSDYVTKSEGKIYAYNTEFISDKEGTRYLIWDIPNDDAINSDSYIIFMGTSDKRFKDQVEDVNVYYTDYIEY